MSETLTIESFPKPTYIGKNQSAGWKGVLLTHEQQVFLYENNDELFEYWANPNPIKPEQELETND